MKTETERKARRRQGAGMGSAEEWNERRRRSEKGSGKERRGVKEREGRPHLVSGGVEVPRWRQERGGGGGGSGISSDLEPAAPLSLRFMTFLA